MLFFIGFLIWQRMAGKHENTPAAHDRQLWQHSARRADSVSPGQGPGSQGDRQILEPERLVHCREASQ
jgi:hypothetical protein